MTKRHPIATVVLRMSGWQPRVWVAIAIVVVLAGLPLPIAGIALWLVAMTCMSMMATLGRMLCEHHSARERLEAERDRYAAQLSRHETHIVELKADLERARSVSAGRGDSEIDVVYRRVGLHPLAPDFLLAAARRAFRAALHPDRHPQHRDAAHDRFLQAEVTFKRIEELRRFATRR
ncbi:hypothetical protein MKK84_19085 [Methylobacterium sp. E-065]|uniref:hypothetical protein n=1 Tax=Methylobacterium sp. E-065 TaxID=2836583 RepID=UPI001FBACE49|nr:hypothetical protein [Methylobacterium sp. E-065]MCJ2019513.1 hypothetical protein [Methylobacterium sp. E-065]